MALLRALRYRLMEGLEDFINLLPRFIARPLGSIVAFVYFDRDWLILVLLPSVLAGALLPVLAFDLPPTESIPAVSVLTVLIAVVWRQWFQMEALRGQLRTREDELDGCTVYEDAEGNIIEN
jgi:membrane protein implicated in regulation of membrane protease activity